MEVFRIDVNGCIRKGDEVYSSDLKFDSRTQLMNWYYGNTCHGFKPARGESGEILWDAEDTSVKDWITPYG